MFVHAAVPPNIDLVGLRNDSSNFRTCELTGCDLDVSAVPELLRVGVAVAAHADAGVDPTALGRGALARPDIWPVELCVPRVLARVAGVCVAIERYNKQRTAVSWGKQLRRIAKQTT